MDLKCLGGLVKHPFEENSTIVNPFLTSGGDETISVNTKHKLSDYLIFLFTLV